MLSAWGIFEGKNDFVMVAAGAFGFNESRLASVNLLGFLTGRLDATPLLASCPIGGSACRADTLSTRGFG